MDLYDKHSFYDLTFKIKLSDGTTKDFPAHRFVLVARSKYFRENLSSRWRQDSEVKLSSKLVDPAAMEAVIHYLYTGDYGDVSTETLRNMVFVCKHLEISELQATCEELLEEPDPEKKKEKREAKETQTKEVALIRSDFEQFLQILLHSAAQINPSGKGEYIASQRWADVADSNAYQDTEIFADIAIVLDGIMFPCHKACLCRSQYFQIMLEGAFSEADLDSTTIKYADTGNEIRVPLLELHDFPPEVFPYVLEYLYTDRTSIPAEIAYDVLLASDMLLVERLKSFAAISLTNQTEPLIDIYELIRTALELNVDRLEQWCIRYFADHFDTFIRQTEFHELIRESAQSIAGRQETGNTLVTILTI